MIRRFPALLLNRQKVILFHETIPLNWSDSGQPDNIKLIPIRKAAEFDKEKLIQILSWQ
jgi:hypothetical protein